MKKKALAIFGICLLLYLGMFGLDQQIRTRKGPWVMVFTNEPSGEASIVISQEKLGIRDVKVILTGEKMTNPAAQLRFDKPVVEVPFGKLLFLDTTYLPGTVTLDLYGHALEVLPRTLRLDSLENPWESGRTYRLGPQDKIHPKPPAKKGAPPAK